MGSALARLDRGGQHRPDAVATALEECHTMPVRRHSSTALTPDVWELRLGVRVSHAFCVAFAKGLGVPLVTSDGRLARGRPSDVEVVLVSQLAP